MSYLTETTTELNLPALRFDADRQEIAIGEQAFPISRDLAETSPWSIVRHSDSNQIAEADVCMNVFAKLIGTPNFHGWLGAVMSDTQRSEEVKNSTLDVMKSVLVTLEPEYDTPELKKPGLFSFNMDITSYNHANLSTYGNCACLHPHPDGLWVDYQDWEEGFCEYDWHNIDFDAQAWSLIAGIGHLAHLAAQDR